MFRAVQNIGLASISTSSDTAESAVKMKFIRITPNIIFNCTNEFFEMGPSQECTMWHIWLTTWKTIYFLIWKTNFYGTSILCLSLRLCHSVSLTHRYPSQSHILQMDRSLHGAVTLEASRVMHLWVDPNNRPKLYTDVKRSSTMPWEIYT